MRGRATPLTLIIRSIRFTRVIASIAALAIALLPATPALAGECPNAVATSATTSPALLPTERTGLLGDAGAKAGGAHAVKRVSVVSATNRTGTSTQHEGSPKRPALKPRMLERGPLTFVENRGQYDSEDKFTAQRGDDTIRLIDDSIVFGLARKHLEIRTPAENGSSTKGPADIANVSGAQLPPSLDRLSFSEKIAGANPALKIEPQLEQPGKYNFLLGTDRSQWHKGVKGYALVTYRDAWRGVDLRLYGQGRDLEHVFVVKPGGDPNSIRMDLSGIQGLKVTTDGSLAIDTAFGELSERKPIAYQTVHGKRAEVPVRVTVAGSSYAFAVGKYDKSSPLVIDPVLLYSTYLGGIHDDNGQAITVDAAGNAYVLGLTASQNFPITANAYQTVRSNLGTYTYDVFVTKISPSGVLLYSTFIGGNSNDYGFAIKVDPLGYVYFAGQTQSTDYPTTPGAFATVDNNCVEGLVTKLSPDGSSLVYSTYIGGSNKIGCGGEFGDNLVEGLALDSSGDAFIAGATGSPDFPVTPSAYQTKYPGGPSPNNIFLAGFAAELSANGSHLIYSTFLGSIGADIGNTGVTLAKSVALDSAGNAYVVGLSDAIPTTSGAYQTTSLGFDAFVVKLNPTGSNAKCATLLGGSGYDEAQAVLLDDSNNIYLAGQTDSNNFPATPGAYVTTAPGGSQVYVAKLSPDCTTLDWASVVEPFQPNPGNLGQFFDLGAIGFARDPFSGDLFVGSDTPDQHLATTPDAAQKSFGGGTLDGFLMQLDPTAANVLYATYFGGTGDDGVNAIALDTQGNVFMTGATTSSTGFPLTPDAFQSTFGGTTGQAVDGHDAFFAALGTGTIGSIYPTSGGNVGSVTLKITGSNLQTGATATLVKGGQQIQSELALLRPDGNELNAIFELGGAAPGAYDVLVTNPDSSTLRMPAAFNVVAGGAPNVWVNISGRSAIRNGTPSNFSITYGNSGNVDAYAVNVFLSFPQGVNYTEIAKFIAGAHAPNMSPPDTTGLPTTYTDSTTGITYLELMLPVITAGGSGAIPIQLTATLSISDIFDLQVFTYPVSFDSYATLQAAAAGTLQNPQTIQMSNALDAAMGASVDAAGGGGGGGGGGACVSLNASKAVDCLKDTINLGLALAGIGAASDCIGVGVPAAMGLVANAVDTAFAGPLSETEAGLTMTQVWSQVGTAIAACAGILVPEAALALGALQALLQLPQLFADCSQVAQPCPQPPTPVQPVNSLDPNDKTGPPGALQGHWVLGSQPLSYTLSFENDASGAGAAPAQQVVVTDHLDPTKFNLNTVQLGPMGFGNTVVAPPPGSSNYSTTVDMGAVGDIADLEVNIQGSLDTSTGLLKWTFSSIDASTGLSVPHDDPTGFLPPNTAGVAPAGAGSVVFSVKPKHGLANGTKVTNQASVVFDTNQPIKTPIWHNKIAQPVAGALSISPRPLDFGNRPIFGSSGPMPVEAITLGNPSGVPILVGNLSTTSNFQIINPQACQTLMNPGQSCTVRIRFVPNAVVAYKGKLIVADNSSSSPQTVALKGVGVPGTLSFTPAPLTFGKVTVNTTGAAKHLKMTNITGAVASVMSVVSSAAEFVVSNDQCTGATLTHNQSCTVDVAFNPMAKGQLTGKLTVMTDSSQVQGVKLVGNGVP